MNQLNALRKSLIFNWRFRGQRTTCGGLECAKIIRYLYRVKYGSPPFEGRHAD